jgi:hydroxymethylpyrimidine pyrophosphatase-like HAD family hydrolase
MHYSALAVDYDGTLAHDGRVAASTVDALQRLRASGRRVILVTGRQAPDLAAHFPDLHVFDRIVAENGALLVDPATGQERLLADPPPPELIAALRDRGVPLWVGRVVVATFEPHQGIVLETIRRLGLEHQTIFNKGAVMVLPPAVNKASGLAVALHEMRLSPHNTVAIGDAENDHAMLRFSECGIAVANALPAVKAGADFVTERDHGAGVVEVIDRLLADDPGAVEHRLDRHRVVFGHIGDGHAVTFSAQQETILVCGASGSGKSAVLTGFLDLLAERDYQCCVVDPEGDHEASAGAVVIGHERTPHILDVMNVLDMPLQSVIVDLVTLPLDERPDFFHALVDEVQGLIHRTGRPHWLILDEARHLLRDGQSPGALAVAAGDAGVILATMHPALVTGALLDRVDLVLATGPKPGDVVRRLAEQRGLPAPQAPARQLAIGEVAAWRPAAGGAASIVRLQPLRSPHRRHRRKYALGDLGPAHSFYFRGPDGRHHLRAGNLLALPDLGDRVDDDTWHFHVQRGDFSRWFREVIRDNDLADDAERIERMPEVTAPESRLLIRAAIERRYTTPG